MRFIKRINAYTINCSLFLHHLSIVFKFDHSYLMVRLEFYASSFSNIVPIILYHAHKIDKPCYLRASFFVYRHLHFHYFQFYSSLFKNSRKLFISLNLINSSLAKRKHNIWISRCSKNIIRIEPYRFFIFIYFLFFFLLREIIVIVSIWSYVTWEVL